MALTAEELAHAQAAAAAVGPLPDHVADEVIRLLDTPSLSTPLSEAVGQ